MAKEELTESGLWVVRQEYGKPKAEPVDSYNGTIDWGDLSDIVVELPQANPSGVFLGRGKQGLYITQDVEVRTEKGLSRDRKTIRFLRIPVVGMIGLRRRAERYLVRALSALDNQQISGSENERVRGSTQRTSVQPT